MRALSDAPPRLGRVVVDEFAFDSTSYATFKFYGSRDGGRSGVATQRIRVLNTNDVMVANFTGNFIGRPPKPRKRRKKLDT